MKRTRTPRPVFLSMKGLGDADEAKVASLEGNLNTKLDVYETILSKQPYMAGTVSSNHHPSR